MHRKMEEVQKEKSEKSLWLWKYRNFNYIWNLPIINILRRPLGIGDSEHSRAMTLHRGKNKTCQKVLERCFWHLISNNVNEFVRKCYWCQKQGDINFLKMELKPVPITDSNLFTSNWQLLPRSGFYKLFFKMIWR